MNLAQETIQALEQNDNDKDKDNGGGKKVDPKTIIKALINTDFGGSNEEQGKAVQLMRGLAFSDDPISNKFMQAINAFTSKMNPDDFGNGGGGNDKDKGNGDKEEK